MILAPYQTLWLHFWPGFFGKSNCKIAVMNKKTKVSLISVGAALAVTPLIIYGVRKIRKLMKQASDDVEEMVDDGRKHLFTHLKGGQRGERDVENLEG